MLLDNYFNLFLLMGAVLSVLLSIYLIFYPTKLFANKVLGLLTFSWSVTVFAFIIQSPDFFSRFPHLYGSLDVFTLLFFPLMYVYLRTYLYSDARKISKNLIHIIPALLYLSIFSPFFFQSAETKIEMIHGNLPDWFRSMQMVFNLVIIFQGIFYSVHSLRKLHHFQYFRKARLSHYQLASLKWLRLFVVINVLLWVVGTLGVILEMLQINMIIDLFRLFYLGLTILTLGLGFFTLRRPEFFSEEEDIVNYVFKRYDNFNEQLDEGKKVSDYKILMDYLENEKPYLKPDLKMQDLVDATGLSYKHISEILNTELKKSFFDVINDFRMQTAIDLIKAGFHLKHTLPHLAEQAGFNSKTTFNRIFKKYTGKTPTEYIQFHQY